MDTAEYETNALVINNISSISYAFYEPVSPSAAAFGPEALELEGALRKDGNLVYVDSARRGLWCFQIWRKDQLLGTQSENSSFAKTVESSGYTLSLAEEGSYEPASLVKHRSFAPNTANTPSSSSSSGSAALEANFRNTQSATLPSAQAFTGFAVEQDMKAVVVSEGSSPVSTPIKETHGHFISATLTTICSAFCMKTGATPLNSRTSLLPVDKESYRTSSTPILASFRIYLTTTGALVAAVSLSLVEGLLSLSDNNNLPPLGITVLAAPLGVFATCQAIADSDHSSTASVAEQSPDTQILRPPPAKDERSQPWRSLCTKLLHARNISSPLSGPQQWLNLQRVRRKPTEPKFDGKQTPTMSVSPSMSWPSSLCFCKAFSKLGIEGKFEESHSAEVEKSYDPLTLAKTWFLGTGEREEQMARERKEREAAAARTAAATDGKPQNAAGLSPLALHRPSNSGAPPGTMYLTPPDGIQVPLGFTPSLDGTVSSPGNNVSATAMVDIDTAMNITGDFPNDSWGNSDVKRERVAGSFDSENLFGDLGPDMFGDENVTDADFNFFDEEPGSMDMSLDIPDLSMPSANLDLRSGFGGELNQEVKIEVADPPVMAAPKSPIFTKPELKHARSLAEEPRRRKEAETGPPHASGHKRQASPFTPDTVFKRIRASLDNRKAVQQNSQIYASPSGSIFDKVDFGQSLSMVNNKYKGNGRFDFSFSRPEDSSPSTLKGPPTTDYLRRHGKGRRGPKEPPTNVGELFAKIASSQNSTSQHPSPSKMDDLSSDADEISLVSDQDDSSFESDEPLSPVKSTGTRRRRVDEDGESIAASFKELDCLDAASPHSSLDLPRFSKSEVELALTKYFADPEPPSLQLTLRDQDFIIAAQLLMEQASTSTLCLAADLQTSLHSRLERRRDLLSVTRRTVQDLQSILPMCFGEPSVCQLRPFIEVQDVPLLGQPTRMQPRPPGVDQLKPNNLFQIPSPHFEMRRYEAKLSVLPSAVSFWESLGLGPSNGNKDINAVCIYPDFSGLKDDADSFLDRMRSVYESLKLGSFNRLTASVDIPCGLLPYQVEKGEGFLGKTSILGNSLMTGLSKLSDVLFHLAVRETNFVIFFIYPTDLPGAVVESCYAFQQLFERYKKLLSNGRKSVGNELALQLVPMDFVACSNSLAAPSPLEFIRLSLETYDRCTLFGGSMPSPAIVLEQSLPRMIDFKLSSTPSSSLLHENTCLHIAYAQSIDERWITVAWTDNRGSQQMTASYCLGRKGKAIATPFAEVAQEIWDTTRDFVSIWKVHWRIMITKCGVMEQSEIEIWSSLAQIESKANVTLTLLTVDTDPSLQLIPPAVKMPSMTHNTFCTTPVSTPQASILSPEQSGNPPTPSLRDSTTSAPTPGAGDALESDADATLVDVTDHAWGAMLSHRLNNSNSLMDFNPAIASGYLVKRSGIRVEDPPVVMEVNIVHNDGNPRAYETLLREMLTYFRALGTLARARGMVENEVDVRPWHVAAAEKGVKALYMLM